MEYAEVTLARLLAQRALAPDALRRGTRPILTSLAFLHRKQLVHGSLKPSNILLVNQQLKLASDTVRPTGESAASIATASAYDPPESRDGSFIAAGDIWSLGVIMVEALTQRLPSCLDRRSGAVSLPAAISPQFAQLIRQCLSRDPADRPTVGELYLRLNPAQPASAQAGSAQAESVQAGLAQGGAAQAAWAQPASARPVQPATVTPVGYPVLLPPEATQQRRCLSDSRAESRAQPLLLMSPARALDLPNALHLTKRRSPLPVGATETARKWKFAAVDEQGTRKWLLWFEFTREGASAHAANRQPWSARTAPAADRS